ncbi:MAG: VOC family protein [Pseudomonadota bacterium]
MITALDHFVLACPNFAEAIRDYEQLLGRKPVWEASADGVASALFAVGNTALEVLGPDGASVAADSLRAITASGAKLTSLVYRSDDLPEDHRLMTRRALLPGEIAPGTSVHAVTGAERKWTRFRIPDAKMAGVKTFVVQPESVLAPQVVEPGAVLALDHLVINTPNPDRTLANYGVRLGLRLALDRTAEQWKTRFLFFRLGDLTLEIIHRLDAAHDPAADDAVWGLTWTTDSLEAAHARLSSNGRNVSEIRTGRKPGTQVFTVRDGTQGIPTLFIAHALR